jgi:GTP-binding protein
LVRYFTQFLTSAGEVRQFPQASAPEIAFLGRSNVGKSSLINSLLGEKVAKTSSTPGRTRTINFFAIRRQGQPRPDMMFVDVPGYGYAKVPREMMAEWPKIIDPYLKERATLALCIVIVDTNIAPQESDKQLVEFLRATGRRFLVVGTKSDRISNNVLRNNVQKLTQELGVEHILTFSAKAGTGKNELWTEIRSAAGIQT